MALSEIRRSKKSLLNVKHKCRIYRVLPLHRTEECQPAKSGNLNQRLHTEELEAEIFVAGCPVHLE